MDADKNLSLQYHKPDPVGPLTAELMIKPMSSILTIWNSPCKNGYSAFHMTSYFFTLYNKNWHEVM